MSHFYGSIPRSSRRTVPTACASKGSGLTVRAASWEGAIEVRLEFNEAMQENRYEVWKTPHHGVGETKLLAKGVVGESRVKVMVKEAGVDEFEEIVFAEGEAA